MMRNKESNSRGRAFGRARFFVYIAPCEMIVKAISRH